MPKTLQFKIEEYIRKKKIMRMMKITSTAVSWDCGLDILAFDTDQLCVLAAIYAAREPAEAACP